MRSMITEASNTAASVAALQAEYRGFESLLAYQNFKTQLKGGMPLYAQCR